VPASVEMSPLFDRTLERVGSPLDHPYIERVYCSVLGPSSVLLLRRAGELFADHPEGARVALVDLSRSLGLGVRADADDIGRNAPPNRTMDRLVRFRMASWLGEDRLGIHPKVPALERHRAARLPDAVQAYHHRLLTAHLDGLVARAEGRVVEPAGAARARRRCPASSLRSRPACAPLALPSTPRDRPMTPIPAARDLLASPARAHVFDPPHPLAAHVFDPAHALPHRPTLRYTLAGFPSGNLRPVRSPGPGSAERCRGNAALAPHRVEKSRRDDPKRERARECRS